MSGNLENINKGLTQNDCMRKILDNLKLHENDMDLELFESYIETFIEENDNSTAIQNCNDTEVLDECLKWVTNTIVNLSEVSAINEIILRKLLFLFSIQKLKILQCNIVSHDLRLTIITNGCKLMKLCIENDCVSNTDYFISNSLSELYKLTNSYGERNLSSEQIQFHKQVLCMYNIEKMIKENLFPEVLEQLRREKDNIIDYKVFQKYFIGLCYNFSLKCKQEKYHEIALNTLLLAYEVCKMATSISKSMKQVLYFFVHICLNYKQTENWHHAINALDLANRDSIDIFYIINKLKIAFISNQPRYLDVLDEAAEWECINAENVKSIVRCLLEHNQPTSAIEFIWKIKRKQFSSNDMFLLHKLEIQICITQGDERTPSLLEDAIDLAKNDVNESSISSLCKLLLFHAGIKLKDKMLRDSFVLYKTCTKLCKVGNLKTLQPYVLMRICLCYFEMGEWNSARQIFNQLEKSSLKANPMYMYLALQISFMSDDETLAEEALYTYDYSKKMGSVLFFCCYKAFSSGKKDFVLKILETMLLKYHTADHTILLAKISQSLIALSAESVGCQDTQDKCLLYMDKALNVLQSNSEHSEVPELSEWFSRAAWNLALTPGIQPYSMFDFFLRCCCFSELSLMNLTRLKNSLLLAAAAGLHVVRQMISKEKIDNSKKEDILSKVFRVIGKGKTLATGCNIMLLRLLHLYEFEARCHANEWDDSEQSLKEVLHLPFMDVKTLEHIAAIAYEFAPSNYKIITEALKVAVKKQAEKENQSISEVSKTYHSLLQVMFHAQEYYSPLVEDETLQLCSNLLNLIENEFKDYPQLEILWLMIKCWNWGLQKLTMSDSKQAYKWCTLALSFLDKLDSLKILHEKKLKDMYSTYFPNSRN